MREALPGQQLVTRANKNGTRGCQAAGDTFRVVSRPLEGMLSPSEKLQGRVWSTLAVSTSQPA